MENTCCYVCGKMQTELYGNRYYCRGHAPRECRGCGEMFSPHASNTGQLFCSGKCRRKYQHDEHAKIIASIPPKLKKAAKEPTVKPPKEKTSEEKVCPRCGELFVSHSANQKYCSFACLTLAQKEAYDRGRFVIFERDNFRCFYCGRSSFKDNAELRIDHVHPRKHGGDDTAGNLVTACERCNLEKSATLLRNEIEILEEVEFRNMAAGLTQNMIIKWN